MSMAKSPDSPRCDAFTKTGPQCSNQPKDNGFCGHHQPNLKTKEAGPPPVDHGFRFEFMDIAREVHGELKDLDIPAINRPQYWNIVVSCIKNAKEEQRLLDGIGAGVQHTFVLNAPQGPRPLPPSESQPELAEKASGDKVVH